MTLSNSVAQWGLTTTVTRTAINALTAATNGVSLSRTEWTDANIFHSFTLTATGTLDVATLTVSTGAIVKTTGTPDVTRFTGNTADTAAVDLEGIALGTMDVLYGVIVDIPTTSAGYVTVVSNNDELPEGSQMVAGGKLSLFYESGSTAGVAGTMAFTLEASGAIATATFIGKTA